MDQKQLTKRSLEQLIEVLKVMQAKWSINKDIHFAYSEAVKKVSSMERVTEATIRDLCTRRLGRINTEQFKGKVDRWLRGNQEDLYSTIKKHATNYLSIDRFFGSQTDSEDGIDPTTTTFQIELDPSVSAVVTKLCKLSGTSPEKMISQYLNTNFRQYLIDLLSEA